MVYSQKYCLVSFIDSDIPAGRTFSMEDWPLHVTIADVFAIDITGSGFLPELESLIPSQHTLKLRVIEPATLGSTEVMLLEKSEPIMQLHNWIVDLIQSHGGVFNSPEYTKDGFLPHCTVQRQATLASGDGVTLQAVSLIDMFPGNDWQQRTVLNTFKLGSK